MPRLGLSPENKAELPAEVRDTIRRANDVPIISVLNDILDAGVPDITHRSWKSHCPFGAFHSDGGASQSMRVYVDTNTCFCFAGCGFMNSVKLIERHTGLKPIRAARHLLRLYGLDQPRSFEERFDEARRPNRAASSTATLAAALHESLLAMPEYEALSLHPTVLSAINGALNELDALQEPTGETYSAWLHSATTSCRQAVVLAVQSP